MSKISFFLAPFLLVFSLNSSANKLEINSLVFEKSEILNPYELASIIEKVKGKALSSESIEKIVGLVEKEYVKKGYPLSYAKIKGQKVVDGILHIDLVDRNDFKFFGPTLMTSKVSTTNPLPKISLMINNASRDIPISLDNKSFKLVDKLEISGNFPNQTKPIHLTIRQNKLKAKDSIRFDLEIFNPENRRMVKLGNYKVSIIDDIRNDNLTASKDTLYDEKNTYKTDFKIDKFNFPIPAFLRDIAKHIFTRPNSGANIVETDICPVDDELTSKVGHNFAPDFVPNIV